MRFSVLFWCDRISNEGKMNDNRVVEVEETDIVALEDKDGVVSYRLKFVRYVWLSEEEALKEYQEMVENFLKERKETSKGHGKEQMISKANQTDAVLQGTPIVQKEQDGRFYCPKCPKSFKHRYDYTMHEKSHSGTNPHYCETCDIYFPRLSKLAKHFRTKSHLRKQEEISDVSADEDTTILSADDDDDDDDVDESMLIEPPTKKIKKEHDDKTSEGASSNKLQCRHCKKTFSNKTEQQLHLAACISKRPRRESILPKDYLKKRAKLKQFFCPLCDDKFSEYADVNQHISEDHEVNENTQFSCKSCSKTFGNKERWVSHLNDTEHMAKLYISFQATCCNKTFKTHKACYNHERVHTRQSPYHCEKCDRYFLKKHHLSVHLKGCQNSERPYACPYCSRSYKTSNQLQHHLEGGHSFQCATCQQNFSCKPYLKAHLEESPSCIKNICSRCNNLEFGTVAELAFHKSEIHDSKGRKTFSCADCGQTYCEAYKLKQHMEWHATGCYPFQCTEDGCAVICYKKSKLESHVKRVHLKIFEYECQTCGEEFKAKKHHDEHRSKVHGAESFTCPICDKDFFTLKTFESHQLSHSKVRTQHVNHQQEDSVLDLQSLTNLSMALDGSSSKAASIGSAENPIGRPTQIEFKIPSIVSRKHVPSPDLEEMAVVNMVETTKIVPAGLQEEVDDDENVLNLDQQQTNNQFVTIKIASSGTEHSSNNAISSETMQQLKSTLSDLLSATLAGGQIDSNTDLQIQGDPTPNEDGVVEIVLMPAAANCDENDEFLNEEEE